MMQAAPRQFSPYDAPFWASVAQDAMALQCCDDCGAFRYPPGPACPRCLSTRATWRAVSGRGRVLSWTVFHRQYLPAYPPPSIAVAVQLEEGPIMVTSCDTADAERLAVDAPGHITYADHPDGFRLPRFRPD